MHRQCMIYVSPMSGAHAWWFKNILLVENCAKVCSRRYDPPLPAAEDYSPLPTTEDLILHYQRDPSRASNYIFWLSSKRKMLLLLLDTATVECREQRAKSQAPQEPRALLRHYSLGRKERSLVRREREWAKKEKQRSQEFWRSQFLILYFQKKEQQLSVLSSLVFLSSCLEEDYSTRISQMIFEHLSIFCSV